MKIIQPLSRTKKDRSSSVSENNEDKHKDYDLTVTADSPRNLNELKSKAWKPRSKKKRSKSFEKETKFSKNNSLLSLDNITLEEEFEFDTSKLEAMPKDEVSIEMPEGKKRRRSELQVEKSTEPLALATDPAKKAFNDLFARGLRLLAMREHSVKEMTNKLFDKLENSEDAESGVVILAVIDELLEKKYLSDERFTDAYIRARGNRGFGPIKIKAELKGKGISSDLIQCHLDPGAAIWFDLAKSQYHKKYDSQAIADYAVWSKRARFLQGRGFNMDQIHCAVAAPESY